MPALIARKLAKMAGARALLLSEVRRAIPRRSLTLYPPSSCCLHHVLRCGVLMRRQVRSVQTCFTAVHTLATHGLRVAAFSIVGREGFQVRLDALPEVGSTLLLVATWPPAAPPS